MAGKKNEKKEKVVTTGRKSVHVIFLSCPHCSSEKDHIELCDECGEPMRVIDVVEKFGEDAERFLSRMEKRKENGNTLLDEDEGNAEEEPNIILMGQDEPLDDGGIDPTTADDDSLDVIFPDEDEDSTPKETPLAGGDLADALEQLDNEDDEDVSASDFGFDGEEIPTL